MNFVPSLTNHPATKPPKPISSLNFILPPILNLHKNEIIPASYKHTFSTYFDAMLCAKCKKEVK